MLSKPILRNILFFVLLIVLGYLYNYHQILDSRPYSMHTWRQTDCLSITKNYYEDNLPFLEPEVHWIGNKGHGRTISEFPIIYYFVAKLWKIFGEHESIFRLINMLILFIGLFYLFKLSEKVLKDSFWAYFIPIFLFTSPLLIFYTNNFLSNTPAFGLALTGCYFYFLYNEYRNKRYLIISMLAFTLGGLLKLTSLLIFLAIFSAIVLDKLIKLIKKEESLKSILYSLVPFLLVLFFIFGWYLYAKHYNSLNHRNLFLQEIFPIWELSDEKRAKTFHLLYWNLIPAYFNKKVLLGLVCIFLSLFFVIKKTDKRFHSILIITFVGMLLYGILWFRALHVHDYYLTNLLVFIPLVLFVFLEYLKRKHPKIFGNYIFKTVAIILLISLVAQGALINRLKFDTKNYAPASDFLLDQEKREYWNWEHWDYKNEKKSF